LFIFKKSVIFISIYLKFTPKLGNVGQKTAYKEENPAANLFFQ
jgi:hypothetical protein